MIQKLFHGEREVVIGFPRLTTMKNQFLKTETEISKEIDSILIMPPQGSKEIISKEKKKLKRLK